MKTGLFRRSVDLFSLAAKVGIKELTSGSVQSRIEQAKLIADSLSQLKGAAMKAGQMMSLDIQDYFPPEAVEILSKLQNQAMSVDFEVIEGVIKKDLGEKYKELKNLSRSPVASASIGQVHMAEVKGKKVAVKVQYPGVRESIDSDLKVIKNLAEGLCRITGRKVNLESVFVELRETLIAETNYLHEIQNMKKYAALAKADSELSQWIHTPTPMEELSSERVIVMSFEEGLPLREWMNSNPSAEDKAWLSEIILKIYTKEFYEWGFVQTDPNLANFLVNGRQLCLLDFGATKSYSEEFRASYKKFLATIPSKDPAVIINAAIEFELLKEEESLETKMKFHNFMKHSIEPFFTQSKDGVFHFADNEYTEKSKQLGREFVLALKYTPPPSKLLFLHRKLGGIFALLKRLEVSLDLTTYWKNLIH